MSTPILPELTQPDLRGSVLAAKEPYHVPGYAGYRPQYKFQCSETYGATTHRLLTSPHVNLSGNSVLGSIDPPRAQSVPVGFHDVPKLSGEDFDIVEIMNNRRNERGDQIFQPKMRSGYMGHVPKAHFSSYHSKPFPEICDEALRDFSGDQSHHRQKVSHLKKMQKLQQLDDLIAPERASLNTKHRLPLRSKTTEPIMSGFVSKDAFQRHESPYFLPDDHPQKHFRSGFAGHVPFYKDLGGHGFPIVTNQALKEFTRERGVWRRTLEKPITGKTILEPRTTKQRVAFANPNIRQKLYLVESGMVPRYAGYVPGEKFRHGKTFTALTVDTLNLGGSKKLSASVS